MIKKCQVITIKTDIEFKRLVAHEFTIVFFSGSHCAPCKTIKPHFELMAIEHPESVFILIDVTDGDIGQMIGFNHNVRSLPTFVVYNQGRVVMTETGTRGFSDSIVPVIKRRS